jgi:eukaryotic-like serine/threonine-protein kinase
MDVNELPPSAGLVAGKYELIRLIGRGGMGSVWEGRHCELGTRVAIKFIESEYAKNEEALKRFKNEALAATRIDSKHAIKIHDIGTTQEGKPYIVMEFLNGEPLDKRIERFGRLSPQDTARIVQQVCRALQRAHDAGIVHRDLKPENIFIVHEDDDEVAKVLDFGIAKMKDPSDHAVSSSTKTGAVLGTPYYMSPEQARGLRTIDHRTDLWSLGVIVYKCITGKLPFDGESLGDLLVKICTAPLPIPSHTLPGLPVSFDAWFARALDRDPNQRYSTATELADSLAYACGVSVRRGPMSSLPTPGQQPYTQPAQYSSVNSGTGPMSQVPSGALQVPQQPYGHQVTSQSSQTPQPNGFGATSPPFVSSTAPQKSGSKGLIFAAIGAAVVGVALGVFGVLKLAGGHDNAQPAPIATPSAITEVVMKPTVTPSADPVGANDHPLQPLTTTPTAPTYTVRPNTNPNTRPTTPSSKPSASVAAPIVTTPPVNTTPPVVTAHPSATHDLGPGF